MPPNRQDPYLFSAAEREVRAKDAPRPDPKPANRPNRAEGFLRLVGDDANRPTEQGEETHDAGSFEHAEATARGWGAVARERAIRENVRSAATASQLSSDDARVIFATKVQECLEGGRAAILRLQRREQLIALSHDMGFRPFDANLIIALVQDAARRGEVLAALQPNKGDHKATHYGGEASGHVRELVRTDEARAGLEMIPGPSRAGRYRVHNPPDTSTRDKVILAVVLALFMLASMIALMGA